MSRTDAKAPAITRGALLAALLLFLATFGLYAPAAENGFVDFDDGSYVTKNPQVLDGLTGESVVWAFTRTHSSNWHPLTWLSHMLDVELFGLDASGHHLVGVGLHALGAALLLLALVSLTGALWPAVVVAALFAFHPLRVESVAWVSERKDVLSGVFFFAALLLYARYARAPSTGRMLAVAAATLLGLLAKPMLVTLPFVLLLLDRWPLRRNEGWGVLVREKAPLFALVLASCALTVFAQQAGGAIRSFESLPLAARTSNAASAYAGYLGKSFWPSGLAVFYPHPALIDPGGYSPLSLRALGSAMVLLGLSVLAVRERRSRPWVFVGWFWFVGMLIPVIGIVQVGAQWMADRYAYLPLVGVYVALVWSAAELVRGPRARAGLTGLGLALALACVPLTRRQLATWRDTRTLFERALAVTERNYVAHLNLGYMEHNLGDLDAAEAHYLAALEIAPGLVDVPSNLGGLYLQRGELDRAAPLLERAVELDGEHVKARLNRGLLAQERGDLEGAAQDYRRAVELDPDSTEARLTLAGALEGLGRTDEALQERAEAVRRVPGSRDARLALARSLVEAGRGGEALPHLDRVRRRAPVPVEALELEAWVRATSADPDTRDPARALALADEACGRTRNAWSSLRARAAALAAAGRYQEAAGVALEAAAAAPEARQPELMELRKRFAEGRGIQE